MSRTGEPVVDHAESLFTLMLDAFVVAGLDGYMKVVNPALAKMLGYSEQELLARPYLELVHPDDVESVEAAFVDLAAGADLVGFVCRLVCADHTVRWVEWHTKARPEEGLVYGVGRDVTEHKMANDELSALRRVATLVAEGREPRELFAVVAKEVAGLIDVPVVGIARYEPDDVATTCASFSSEGPLFPIGRRWSLEGTSTLRLVRDTSAPARIDDYSGLEGEVADTGSGGRASFQRRHPHSCCWASLGSNRRHESSAPSGGDRGAFGRFLRADRDRYCKRRITRRPRVACRRTSRPPWRGDPRRARRCVEAWSSMPSLQRCKRSSVRIKSRSTVTRPATRSSCLRIAEWIWR